MVHISMLLPSPSACWLPLPGARQLASSTHALRGADSLLLPLGQHDGGKRGAARSARAAASGYGSNRGDGSGRRGGVGSSSEAATRGGDSASGAQEYFATCHPGLEGVVAAELASPQIGAFDIRDGKAGVYFRRASAQAVQWCCGGLASPRAGQVTP